MKISSHNKFYRIQLKQLFFDPSRIESQFRKKKKIPFEIPSNE